MTSSAPPKTPQQIQPPPPPLPAQPDPSSTKKSFLHHFPSPQNFKNFLQLYDMKPELEEGRRGNSSSSSLPAGTKADTFPQQQQQFFKNKKSSRRGLWLALSLVSLFSAALLLLLAHPGQSPPPYLSVEDEDGGGGDDEDQQKTLSPQAISQQREKEKEEDQANFPPLELFAFNASNMREEEEDPSQKSKLPLASHPAMFNETGWSSYRPQLYFGLKNRRPDSPLFGIMWYRQNGALTPEELSLRNWAKHEDEVVFMWNQHDGRSFGSQKLVDGEQNIRTDFFSFGAASWMARFYLQRQSVKEEKKKRETTTEAEEEQSEGRPQPETGGWKQQQALILYFALQDDTSSVRPSGGHIRPGPSGEFRLLEGKSDAVLGKFSLIVRPLAGKDFALSATAFRADPLPDMAKASELVKTRLHRRGDGNFAFFDWSPSENEEENSPNFVALQISTKENTAFELLFQSEHDEHEAPAFMDGFRAKEEAFRANFSRAFPIAKNYSAIYHKMGHAALSNLLGGIGVWHGSCKMRSHKFSPPDSVKPYGPLSLMSAVPSRTGFPRGFIWDEGFHNMLIHKFDPSLSIQIIGTYLDMMNIDGWMPREIAIGSEAEARIPGTFLVQEDWVANPPMFFYLMRDFIQDKQMVKRFGPELVRMYPRMKQLYLWLRSSQRGPKPGTFRWIDRNQTTNLELNPCSLGSGLDDYPRATHPTNEEYHLDIRCWMAMSANVLAELATAVGDEQFAPAIQREALFLSDVALLDSLHWSEEKQQYCDYGLHSDSVELVPEITPEGETILVRKVLSAPRYRLVENVNGVMNLFPLFMCLLPADSPRLPALFAQIADPAQFWTPYGLRSISPTSPYYNTWNSKWGSPYWRGPIWINMNYFAIAALKHYSLAEGPHREAAARLHVQLRDNLLGNVAKQYAETGFLWEHYNDKNGQGEGNHPFTGWTTLVLKILSDTY